MGADAVTHRRVAQVAGLPLASTTYWFDSKEHLLTAALERAADQDIARLHTFLSDAPEDFGDPLGLASDALEDLGDPLGLAIDAILDPVAQTGQSSRGWLIATYTLMLEAARRPSLRDVTRRWTDAYLDALARVLALAGSEDPREDAALLLATADGLLVTQLATGDTAEVGPQLRRLADALVNR